MDSESIVFIYEGSSTTWYDPVYNVVTLLGLTWRYSHWMKIDSELFIYAEVSDPDESHTVRMSRIKME